jgi:hypothetical protein
MSPTQHAHAAGNGATSNANPYAHFAWSYQDRLRAYPTYTYTLAHTTWKYGNYTGEHTKAMGRDCAVCSLLSIMHQT